MYCSSRKQNINFSFLPNYFSRQGWPWFDLFPALVITISCICLSRHILLSLSPLIAFYFYTMFSLYYGIELSWSQIVHLYFTVSNCPTIRSNSGKRKGQKREKRRNERKKRTEKKQLYKIMSSNKRASSFSLSGKHWSWVGTYCHIPIDNKHILHFVYCTIAQCSLAIMEAKSICKSHFVNSQQFVQGR